VRRRLDLDLDRRGGFGLGGLFVVRGDGFLNGVDDGVFHVLDGVLDGLDGVLDGLGGRGLSLVGGLWGGGKGGGMREERGREREKKEEATLSSFADFFSLCGLALFLFSPLSCTSASPLSAVRGGKGLKNRAQKKRERERDRERERGEEEKERAWKNQKEKKGDSATEGGGMESRARKHCSASWLNKQPRSCSRAHRAALDGVEKRARKGEEGEERRARNHCRRSRSRAREFFFLFFRRRPSSAVKKASIFPLLVAANVAAASSSTGVHVPPRSPARSGRRSCP
jgi:hypothetical protein